MKRVFFVLILVCSFLSSALLPSISNAAVLLNKNCTKLGAIAMQSGTKYICKKSGKKYIWRKAPSPSPSPSPISNSNESSTNQSLLSEDDKKLEAIFELIKAKMEVAKPAYEIQVNVDPILAKSVWSKDSVNSITSATKLLSALGVNQIQPMKFYISWGDEYKNQFIPEYCKWPSGGGSCGQTGIMFADLKYFANEAIGKKDGVETPYFDEMHKFSILANLPHEMAHYASTQISESANNTDFYLFQPAWLREGVAEYFKLISYAYDNKLSYKFLHDLYALNGGLDRCSKFPLITVSANDSKSDGCEYAMGLFAVEYLILKTGKIESIFNLEKTPGTDTVTNFKKAFGFSLSDFSTEADTYLVGVRTLRK